ncbi:hypothetical protein WJX79_003176 [Trebouxia sp. C0005]
MQKKQTAGQAKLGLPAGHANSHAHKTVGFHRRDPSSGAQTRSSPFCLRCSPRIPLDKHIWHDEGCLCICPNQTHSRSIPFDLAARFKPRFTKLSWQHEGCLRPRPWCPDQLSEQGHHAGCCWHLGC